MAINVNEEGVMKPLTIDGTQTSGFTINGIELLFDGTLEYKKYDEKYYNMPQLTLPRSPQDYKFFIILGTIKSQSSNYPPSISNTIALIDLERFFDGALQLNTGSIYDHNYWIYCGGNSVMLKDNPDHTILYMARTETNATTEYHHKIFGVY